MEQEKGVKIVGKDGVEVLAMTIKKFVLSKEN